MMTLFCAASDQRRKKASSEPNCRAALKVLVEVDAHHLVGRQKAVGDALLEAVAVDRLAEVMDAGNLFGFLGRRRQTDVSGAGEIGQDLAPGRIFSGAAAVAFVDDNEVEEVRRELFVDVLFLLGARHGLVER